MTTDEFVRVQQTTNGVVVILTDTVYLQIQSQELEDDDH